MSWSKLVLRSRGKHRTISKTDIRLTIRIWWL